MAKEITQAIELLELLMAEHNVQLDEKTKGRLRCLQVFEAQSDLLATIFLEEKNLKELHSEMGNKIKNKEMFLSLLELWITRTNQLCLDVVFNEQDVLFETKKQAILNESNAYRKEHGLTPIGEIIKKLDIKYPIQ